MVRWRFFLVLVMIAGLFGASAAIVPRAPAQSTPSTVQVLETSGNPGAFSAPIAVVRCRYANVSLDYRASIDVPGFSADALPGLVDQRIVWEPRLYQVATTWPNEQVLRSGPAQDQTVTTGSVSFAASSFADLSQGAAYIAGGRLAWFSGTTEVGAIAFVFDKHDSFRETTIRFASNLTSCAPIAPATVALSTYRTTVNVTVHLSGRYFPVSSAVAVTWKGQPIAQTMSDAEGNVTASIRVPAAPIGDYPLGLDGGSLWKPAATLSVAPRIKVIPDGAARGETVKISLRGFAKKDALRVRWKYEGRWIEVGWVTTSNTGSGDLWITVPAWAADGTHSVRADGSRARGQTNAATVFGGPPVISLASENDTPVIDEPAPATPGAEPGTPEPAIPTAEPTVEETTPPDATPEPELAGDQDSESETPVNSP